TDSSSSVARALRLRSHDRMAETVLAGSYRPVATAVGSKRNSVVTGPIPGSASSCSTVAVLRCTGPPDVAPGDPAAEGAANAPAARLGTTTCSPSASGSFAVFGNCGGKGFIGENGHWVGGSASSAWTAAAIGGVLSLTAGTVVWRRQETAPVLLAFIGIYLAALIVLALAVSPLIWGHRHCAFY